MLPDDVAAALRSVDAASDVSAHAKLYGAIGGPVGETHLVRCGDRVFAVSRASFFDPYRAIELARDGVVYEERDYTRRLSLTALDGATHRLEVSILDVSSLETFVRALQLPADRAPPPTTASQPEVRASLDDRAASLDDTRAALLDALSLRANRVALVELLSTHRARRATELRRRAAERRAAPPEPKRRAPEAPTPVAKPKREGKPPKKRAAIKVSRDDRPAPAPSRDTPLFERRHLVMLLIGAPLLWAIAQMIVRLLR